MQKIEALQGGQCDELAFWCYVQLQIIAYQINHSLPIELMMGENFPHTFVALNRPMNSCLQNWQTWGDKCYIVDPWIMCYFSAKKIPHFWEVLVTVSIPYTAPSEN